MSYPIIPIFIPHVGCPNDCVFCNQRRIASTICAPKPEEVSALIASGLEKNLYAQVAFYGGSFTAIDEDLQNQYLSAANAFGDRITGIRISTRPDAINDAIVARLKEFGVTIIEIGAQSMDDYVLVKSGRGHTAQDTFLAGDCIKRGGVALIIQMMIGLPGDRPDGAMETAKKIALLSPQGVRIYPTVVIRDTILADMWQKGEYSPLTLDQAVEISADILEIFEETRIPVIRMGLNPTDDLSGGDALAGAYHPAFGQLVSAHRWYLRIIDILKKGSFSEKIQIRVHPSQISNVAGQHGENKRRIIETLGFKNIKIMGDSNLLFQEIRIIDL